VFGDLKNRCSWRMAEGFSKKNSVREADWAVITYRRKVRSRCAATIQTTKIAAANEKRTLLAGTLLVNGRIGRQS
jgi:hypothetical protein